MVPQWRPWPLKADLAGKLPDAKVLTWVNLVPLNPDPNLDFWGHPAKLAYIANQILKHLLVKRTRDKVCQSEDADALSHQAYLLF